MLPFDAGDVSKERRPTRTTLVQSLTRGVVAAICLATAFFLGRRSSAPAPDALGRRSTADMLLVANPSRDSCAWPPTYRPLEGQEWLDASIIAFEHPLLPAGAPRTSVLATRRPGASYAALREFWATTADGTWEPTTFRIMRGVLSRRPGAHWDIGAWVGPTTLFAAHFASRVVAMEPDPRAFSELLGNVRLNADLAASARIVPYRHCLAREGGRVEMTGPVPLGSSMSRVRGLARAPKGEALAGTRTVSWPADCSTPAAFAVAIGLTREELALVKLDVEGAEAVILPLIIEWLRGARRRPAILVELHRDLWVDPRADTERIAAALATFPHVYVSREKSSRYGAHGPQDLVRFDPAATWASTAHVCPDDYPDDYCVVLASDEAYDWDADRAWVDTVDWSAIALAAKMEGSFAGAALWRDAPAAAAAPG